MLGNFGQGNERRGLILIILKGFFQAELPKLSKRLVPVSQVKIWFQNRRMKWRNSKEKEVLSNQGLPDEGLQEMYVSRCLNFSSSPCPVWEMSEQQSSSRWQNFPECAGRLSNRISLWPHIKPTLSSDTSYLYQERGTIELELSHKNSDSKNDGKPLFEVNSN